MPRSTFFSPQAGRLIDAPQRSRARFTIGDVVRHKVFDFRGVVFDIDPVFANSEEWYESIPAEVRPIREQPFYHLLADHPSVDELFEDFAKGRYQLRRSMTH
jgi:heat shock protein HspQ